MMSLGTKIKRAREAKQLTQQELADLMGLDSVKALSSWESDRYKPDAEKVACICKVLGCSLEYLFDIEANNQNENMIGLNDLELDLILDYRELDEIGKWTVSYNCRLQKERCNVKQVSDDTIKEGVPLGITKDMLFLKKTDPLYKQMKEKTKLLIEIKSKCPLTYEVIQAYMAKIGYNGLLSIKDLMLVNRGLKVPSEKLYNDYKRILEKGRDFVKQW